MSAEIRPIKTLAEEALAKSYAGAKATLPGGKEIESRRDAAFRQFESGGLPHRRIEQWKYTDLRTYLREAKPLAGAPDAAALKRAQTAGATFSTANARRLVFVDGSFAAELSDLADLEPGLTIMSLADALARGVPEVMARLSEPGPADGDLAFSLNTSFMGDGAVIAVEAAKRIDRPIHLVFAYTSEQAAAFFARSLLFLGDGAQLTLLESHEGPDGPDYQANSALDIAIGEAAVLHHVKVGFEGNKALHISTVTATLGKDAKLHDFSLVAGGALVRNQFFVKCAGTGVNVKLGGASLLKGNQHADTTLIMDHAVSSCESRELFKSVLDDNARSVFQGKIIVRPDAQKTDARMMTQALLLSETAEANAKPELEIFADDVQCGHGATVGELDETLKFYLMARGVPAKEAEALLIEAFIGEAVDAVENESVQEALRGAVSAKLATRA
jgi:Fe-S cluster assembly protein SufD